MLSAVLSDRIRRLVPSLASSFDGEVIAVRNAIARELAAGGEDWHALAAALAAPDQTHGAPSPCSAEPPSFGDLARACRDLDQGGLREHERAFVHQMCRLGFSGRPSQRQTDWLASIYARLQRRAA